MTKARKPARKRQPPSSDGAPRFDVWICEGRMCNSFGAEELSSTATEALHARADAKRCRVLRGGCFGLCELAANVVVRRHSATGALPSPDDDRLSLTHRDNETVYSQVTPEGLLRIVSAHLDDDRVDPTQTQASREEGIGTRSTVAERMRALRERRRTREKI